MAFYKSRVFRWLVAPCLILVLAIAAYPLWLRAAGNYLVHGEQPFPAEMIVVLAGGWSGNRILKGAELAKQGYAAKILVSGPANLYGWNECELAIPFAIKNGYPGDWFIPLPNHAQSTKEEAEVVLSELRRRGVKRFLVVTSDYHTRRAREVYRNLAPRLEFRIVAAPDPDCPTERWWTVREGRKTVFLEWLKTVAYWLGA